MRVVIIINEDHTLLPEQEEILTKIFSQWETILVPASGWTIAEQKKIRDSFAGTVENNYKRTHVVFVSPVPYLLSEISAWSTWKYVDHSQGGDPGAPNCSLFHNDHREKKELPNGKIITVTAKTGWQLV